MSVRVRLKKEFRNRYAFPLHNKILLVDKGDWEGFEGFSDFFTTPEHGALETCHFEEVDEHGEPLSSIKPELYPALVRLGCKIDNQVATWNHETARLDAVRSFLSGFLDKYDDGSDRESIKALKDLLKDYDEAAIEAIDWFNRIYHEMKRKEQK